MPHDATHGASPPALALLTLLPPPLLLMMMSAHLLSARVPDPYSQVCVFSGPQPFCRDDDYSTAWGHSLSSRWDEACW
jgi:hypothetical protein